MTKTAVIISGRSMGKTAALEVAKILGGDRSNRVVVDEGDCRSAFVSGEDQASDRFESEVICMPPEARSDSFLVERPVPEWRGSGKRRMPRR